ncbi:hypothetical protein [Alicyclobacillus dauci]|uniref:Uncharacterized protein n=1 Tax=Alicyclobacillus dauci TaxID=1475485 RepID=A0ABY6Z6U1_9BACL|nr:hypothetical protein [Alicyclobacillus dauci]WAH38607.1 hypothetical protein NZD86_09050 [Alicyclobacillus dauci]
MSEWAEDIRQRVLGYNRYRSEVRGILKKLLNEIKTNELGADLSEASVEPLEYEIQVGPWKRTITQRKINEARKITEVDGRGNVKVIGERDLEEALRILLYQELDWK